MNEFWGNTAVLSALTGMLLSLACLGILSSRQGFNINDLKNQEMAKNIQFAVVAIMAVFLVMALVWRLSHQDAEVRYVDRPVLVHDTLRMVDTTIKYNTRVIERVRDRVDSIQIHAGNHDKEFLNACDGL